MLHEPAQPVGKDPASPYKTRIGNRMFLLYALIYAGFVAIGVSRPAWMGIQVFAGLNLAVVYGFFLIAFALVLALLYNRMCGLKEKEMAETSKGEGH